MKNKYSYKIVAINFKKTSDSGEIYDCTNKDNVPPEEVIDSDVVNLKHYSNLAVLREKRKNTKKKNWIYVFLQLDLAKNTSKVLELSEGEVVNYMTRAEFKNILNQFYQYEEKLHS